MTLITATAANAQSLKSLPACPNSPNCVSSQANINDAEHFIAPFKLTVASEQAWAALQNALLQQSRTIITTKTDVTLHAEVTSLIFRFVDDVEAILDEEAKLIHIRSASKTGHSDFGVNRKRVEALRQALQQARVIE
ncbi:MAG: DUF1499 domain-containing protein [Methylococcales bacterium]|nr:DUF1499 domain-containing protein [Methylococcales bacterium]